MKRILAMMMALAMLVGCGGGATTEGGDDQAADSDTIYIGGLAPLTGDVSIYGVSATNGVKIAVDEINEAGGILGKQIKFESYDTQGDSTEAVTAYTRHVDNGAFAVIGEIVSKPTAAVAEASLEDGTPLITPTGTMQSITQGKANVFRQCFTDPYQGEVLARYVANDLGAKTVGVVFNTSDDYSVGVKDAFVAEAKANGLEVVAEEGYGGNDTDFKPQLTKMVSAKPDVLLIPDYYKNVALIAAQAREVGLESTFVGPDGWDGVLTSIDASNLGAVEGAFFSNHFSVKDTNEIVANFVNKYKEKHGEDPTAFSALGYDTVYMLKQAIEEVGELDKAKVNEAIAGIEFSGVTGGLTFDENHDPIKEVTIMTIKDGDYEFETLTK